MPHLVEENGFTSELQSILVHLLMCTALKTLVWNIVLLVNGCFSQTIVHSHVCNAYSNYIWMSLSNETILKSLCIILLAKLIQIDL